MWSYWEKKMAEKTNKQTLCSMKDIVDYMLESEDEIDLGGHSPDESDIDSNWGYEEEVFQVSAPTNPPESSTVCSSYDTKCNPFLNDLNTLPTVSNTSPTSSSLSCNLIDIVEWSIFVYWWSVRI